MTAAHPSPAYVVDTSIALKWFVESGESNVLQAHQLREAYLNGRCTLRAPEFLLLELANALTTGLRLKMDKVLEALDAVRRVELYLETLRAETLARAVEIASSYGVTVYDSYFLAMAVESDSILVTADEIFLRKARRYPSIVSLRQLRLPG